MKKLNLMAGVGVSLALAFAAGHASAATLDDGVHIVSDGTTVLWTQADESHEYFEALQAFTVPTGFVDGTVYLTGPASGEAPIFGQYSDAFTLIANNGHVDVYFISEGASALERSKFVAVGRSMVLAETGNWQDVSSFYNQGAGFAQILSDVPEPTTWALMLLGFGAVGMTLRNRRAPKASLA